MAKGASSKDDKCMHQKTPVKGLGGDTSYVSRSPFGSGFLNAYHGIIYIYNLVVVLLGLRKGSSQLIFNGAASLPTKFFGRLFI